MKPNISIFFPAYNEQENIQIIAEKSLEVMKKYANDYEIIFVVYEGSNDNTIRVVKELSSKNPCIKLVIQQKEKHGVGYAIILGFESAIYENIFYTDADNQFDLGEIKFFLPHITEFDIIAGYRAIRKDPLPRLLASKIYNNLVRILFDVREVDVDCAFRYVNKRVFEKVRLICNLGLGTTEILVKARKFGFKIKQIPVTHYPRLHGRSVFAGELIGFPKARTVFELIKEMKVLKNELKKIKKKC